MRHTFEDKLTELIRPEVEGLGCTLWGLTAPTKGKKRIVRIYIEGEGGATIDKCAEVSRQVGLMLEVEDIIPGAFTLEVSSPGLDRRFFSTEQMKDYMGKDLTAQTYEAIEGRRKFKGILRGTEESDVVVLVDDHEYTMLGESWHEGPIVLSWPEALAGGRGSSDGSNFNFAALAAARWTTEEMNEENLDFVRGLRQPATA